MRRLVAAASTVVLATTLLITAPVPAAAQGDPPGGAGRYQQDGDAGGFVNIVPPGQDGVLNTGELLGGLAGTYPEHVNDQTAMYEELVYAAGLPVDGDAGEPFLGITDGELDRWFKDGSFGTSADIVPIDVAGCGPVVAFRDVEFGVPHIYGETREAAQCANGYATAEDRLFLMDVLRHVGRARMSELLGASEANKAMDRAQLLVAPYTEEELTAQAEAICGSDDPELQRTCADGTAYLDGVNAYLDRARLDPTLLPGEYLALQILPQEFVLEDIIATASLVGGIFGKGGGAEAANSMFLAALQDQHGAEEGRAIFDDLKAADDLDGSFTIQTAFPYNQHDDVDDTTTALLEPGSFVGAFGDAPLGGLGGGAPELPEDGGAPGLGDLLPGLGGLLPGLADLLPGLGGALPTAATATAHAPSAFLVGAGAGAGTGSPDGGAATPQGWPAAQGPTTLGIVDGPFGPIDLRTPLVMSNAILAGADVSDGGTPLAVFGPQTGYFTPQLLVETDIHAPGLDARGVAFAGTNIYVQLGRGRDYAWSATSASGDLVDEWALELCEPDGGTATIDSPGYVWDGECRAIPVLTHTQIAKPSLGGIPSTPSPDNIVFTLEVGRIPELGGGPVVGRALTTDGTPVAIAEQRSTYGDELASAIGFQRINDPDFMDDGVESFNRAFDGVDYTFNWFYVDRQDIAYRHSCLCPVRDPSTDPDLLTWGGRGHQWTGAFLAPEQQPQEVNPDSGFFANWNNRQAPGFRTEDSSSKHHSADRREHLSVRMADAIASGLPLTRGDMVNIMEDAGTVDLNGQQIYPLALQVMGDEPPADLAGDPRLVEAREVLADWVAAGGHRRDVDRDGVYDHAVAVAIGDAWVRPVIDAVLGDEVPLELWPEGVEDHPRNGQGSAYNSGRIRFVQEELWQVLDLPVQAPRSRLYCADGTAEGCGAVLWGALAEAIALLESEGEGDGCGFPASYRFGSPSVADWVYDAACDDIVQGAAGVVAAPNMRWVNRPTFQQVVQVGSDIGRIGGRDRTTTATALSRHAFPDGADAVVLAAAGSFADAVAGTPLAAAEGAPLLLTAGDALSPAALHEIRRLGATRAIVLGGTAAVGEAVTDALADAGVAVERIAGDDRFATSAAIAERLGSPSSVVVASGRSFADALAAGPFAAADGRAILLVEPDGVPAGVQGALAGVEDVVIAGGEAAVGAAVADALPGTVTRVGGDDRYGTALAFTERAVAAGLSDDVVYAVTGAAFPDALAGGATAVAAGGSLLLLDPGSLDAAPEASAFIGTRPSRVWFVGGEAALPSRVRAQLEGRR